MPESHSQHNRLPLIRSNQEIKQPKFCSGEILTAKRAWKQLLDFLPNNSGKLAEEHRVLDTFIPTTKYAITNRWDMSCAQLQATW
jgi:hypothetical protein